MRIVTFNVNGLRSALNKGLREWILAHDADVYLLQEIKIDAETVNGFSHLFDGYHWYSFSAEKKGYSGVATLCKQAPLEVIKGSGHAGYDSEGRFVITRYPQLTIVNVYIPSGTSGEHRQAVKDEFMPWFTRWVADLRGTNPNLVVAGDYNVANTALDIHDPVRNKTSSGFLPHEREWLTDFFEKDMHDAFRRLYPDSREYSWWSFRSNARANNKGWRIDYQAVSTALLPKLRECRILGDVAMSDHCPVEIILDL
ncbi:MAG: exodeoxyribonuclease III [Bacteroidetes bacterium]|nr:exodeoxyribonuclease III [Bacteroidota bacterium]